MTFYDRTKEDSRPWRAAQDTQAQAADDAAEATAAAIQERTQDDQYYNGVVVTPATATLAPAGTEQLEAEVVALSSAEVEWSSSDEGVATVDTDGLVTAVADGEAVITATAGEFSGAAVITVETV